MKNIQVKIVSVLLSASVLFSIASCSGSNSPAETGTGENRSGKKITADTPWFYNKQIEVEPDLDSGKQVDYTYNQLAGADDKYIVVLTSGYYSMPTGNDIDWDNYNYNAYAIALVSVIDRQTNQTVKCIDLADNLDSNDYLDSASYYDGTITAKYFGYNPNTYISTQKEMDIDVESGNVIATREEEESNGNYERSFKFGDYRIDTQDRKSVV